MCEDSVYHIFKSIVSGTAAAHAPGMDERPSERFSPPTRCVKILEI